jgi:hypothetical protein
MFGGRGVLLSNSHSRLHTRSSASLSPRIGRKDVRSLDEKKEENKEEEENLSKRTNEDALARTGFLFENFIQPNSDDKNLYKLAILIAGGQALLLLAIAIFYFNWLMLQSCIVPFFWAAAIGVCLRGVKDSLFSFFNSIDIEASSFLENRTEEAENDAETEQIGPIALFGSMILQSFRFFLLKRFIKTRLFFFYLFEWAQCNIFMVSFFVVAIAIVFCSLTLGTLYIFLLLLLFFSFFILLDRSYYNTLATSCVLLLTLSLVVILGNFCISQLLREGLMFLKAMQAQALHIVNDPSYAFFISY